MGLIPLHVLYHACESPIFGFEMIQELQAANHLNRGLLLRAGKRLTQLWR